jgi:polygalacturonase
MNEVNVKTACGAVGDGQTDDTAKIKRAIKMATESSIGAVYFPPGTYLISDTLEISNTITLRGDGWSTHWLNPSSARGSWIHVKNEGFNAVRIEGHGCSIRNLGFVYEQLTPRQGWTPRSFDWN